MPKQATRTAIAVASAVIATAVMPADATAFFNSDTTFTGVSAPSFVSLKADDVTAALLASATERDARVRALAERVGAHQGLVTIRLDGLSLAGDRLNWSARKNLAALDADRTSFDATYETATAALLADVIDTARTMAGDDLQISVQGLPVETRRHSQDEARAINDRYEPVFATVDAIVSTQSFISGSRASGELSMLRAAMPEAMAYTHEVAVVYNSNGRWRSVETAPDVGGIATAQGGAESSVPQAPDPIQAVMDAWGQSGSEWDLNGDGTVDNDDLMIVIANLDLYTSDDDDEPSDGVGSFHWTGGTYRSGSGQNMAFDLGSDAPEGADIIFQTWSLETQGIEAPYVDYEAPFVYPAAALDEVTLGAGLVQAIVRDADDQPVEVVELALTFEAGEEPGFGGSDDGAVIIDPDDRGPGRPANDSLPGDDIVIDDDDDDDGSDDGGDDGSDDGGDDGGDDGSDDDVPTGPAPEPVINVIDTEGTAPFTVHVHAHGSDPGQGDKLTARYVWDFDDESGDYNRVAGWNAAHTYDAPGTYEATLTIMNEGGVIAQTSVDIVVAGDDRGEIYVAENGSDGNLGGSPESPVRTLERAIELCNNDTNVLFNRGDTFSVPSGVSVIRRNVVFCAYGSGSRPKIKWTGSKSTHSIFNLTSEHSRDIVFEDLHFTSAYPNYMERNIVVCVRPAGENITMRRCKFTHVTTGMDCEQEPTGVFGYDNVSPLHDGLRAYYTWADGYDHTHFGNIINGSMHEHNLRVGGAERLNISFNDFTNQTKTCLWLMIAKNAYVAHNRTTDGFIRMGPNPFNTSAPDRSKWHVIESNHIVKMPDGVAAIETKHGTEHVMIRNNIIEVGDGTSCIYLDGWNDEYNRTTKDVRILNNTGVTEGDSGRFGEFDTDLEDIVVMNNLYVAPNLETGSSRSAILFIEDDDLDGFEAISHNVWPIPADFHWVDDGYHYCWPYWSDADGYRSPDEWDAMEVPESESYVVLELDELFAPGGWPEDPVDVNPVPGVFFDFHGNERPLTGVWTAGAVEIDSDP